MPPRRKKHDFFLLLIKQILYGGLDDMERRPQYFKQFNPSNGYGSYDDFIFWIQNYLEACEDNPKALISVCR